MQYIWTFSQCMNRQQSGIFKPLEQHVNSLYVMLTNLRDKAAYVKVMCGVSGWRAIPYVVTAALCVCVCDYICIHTRGSASGRSCSWCITHAVVRFILLITSIVLWINSNQSYLYVHFIHAVSLCFPLANAYLRKTLWYHISKKKNFSYK